MSSVRPWSRGREVFSGTSFLMNPVLPAYFITAYAVALFCFMLVLCGTRGLPLPIIRDPRLPRGCLHPPRIPPQNNIVCFAKQLFRIIILLTLCSVYAGLCVCLYTRLYAVFMLFDYAKKGVFDDSFTLLLMLALCASSLCEQCFTFCFMLALCAIFFRYIFSIKYSSILPALPKRPPPAGVAFFLGCNFLPVLYLD